MILLTTFNTADNAAAVFRPIREDPIGSSSVSVLSSPTAMHSPISNITARGGMRADYRRSTIDYVDNSHNNNNNNMDYGKGVGEDRLVHLMDKLQFDSNKINSDRQNPVNGFVAVPSSANSTLSNNTLCPILPQDKLSNGDVKTEANILFLSTFLFFLFYLLLFTILISVSLCFRYSFSYYFKTFVIKFYEFSIIFKFLRNWMAMRREIRVMLS